MKCLTSNEALDLCSPFLAKKITENGKGTLLRLQSGNEFPLWGRFEQGCYKVEFLVQFILQETINPVGYLVWLQDWNIFSKDGGLFEIVSKLRESYGETRLLIETPVFHFNPDETDLCKDLIRIVMAFDWGCYVVPLDGKTLIEIHDEGVALWGFNKNTRGELKTVVDWKS
jgi:hypothetical protein